MISYVIVCPMAFLAGYIDSIAGGGGLISLPAYLIAGLPPHLAIGTNKLSSAAGTTVATIRYYRKGYMKAVLCIPAVITAILAGFLGARINLIIDDRIIRIVLLVILPVIAFYVLKTKDFEKAGQERLDRKSTLIRCIISAFIVGTYDGMYGPGTGTFLLLLLTGYCRISLNDAAGTTKAINLTTNIVSLAVFLTSGNVVIRLGLAAAVFNMAGNYLGSSRFSENGARAVRPVILFVLAVFFIKTVAGFL